MNITQYSNPTSEVSAMKIECRYDKLVPVGELKPYPKNRNTHSPEQIERLAKLLRHHKLRAPIIVSNQSGYIMKGHGTLKAIVQNQWTAAPVVYQDFDNDDAEYQFCQADNAIAEWAVLDLSGINTDIADMGPFDVDLLGIKDFVVDPFEKEQGSETIKTPENTSKELDINSFDNFQHTCPKCSFGWNDV